MELTKWKQMAARMATRMARARLTICSHKNTPLAEGTNGVQGEGVVAARR